MWYEKAENKDVDKVILYENDFFRCMHVRREHVELLLLFHCSPTQNCSAKVLGESIQ